MVVHLWRILVWGLQANWGLLWSKLTLKIPYKDATLERNMRSLSIFSQANILTLGYIAVSSLECWLKNLIFIRDHFAWKKKSILTEWEKHINLIWIKRRAELCLPFYTHNGTYTHWIEWWAEFPLPLKLFFFPSLSKICILWHPLYIQCDDFIIQVHTIISLLI